ncbi:MAG: hypothetical protein ACTSUC_16030 [Promethearchaeota archaeon]
MNNNELQQRLISVYNKSRLKIGVGMYWSVCELVKNRLEKARSV